MPRPRPPGGASSPGGAPPERSPVSAPDEPGPRSSPRTVAANAAGPTEAMPSARSGPNHRHDRWTLSALGATVPLFGFFMLLSGKTDALHLILGAVAAVSAALFTQRLYRVRPIPLPTADFLRIPRRLHHFVGYALWLLGKIFVSAFAVARVVLHPQLPIRPRLVRIADNLPHPVARLTLAHSITLTPGTVTLECDDQEMVVHALDRRSAAGLRPAGGAIADRVRRLYRTLSPSR